MTNTGKKNAREKKKLNKWLLFWPIFLVGLALLFMVNLEGIKKTLEETRILEHFDRNAAPDDTPAPDLETSGIEGKNFPALSNNEKPIETKTAKGTPKEELTEKPKTATADSARQNLKTVDRSVYLMTVDNAGAVYWTKVKRTLPVSDQPLQDALESVIKGPSAEEEKQGIISLIPKNSKILGAVVRGNTAYISFSEDFLFNTYGTEGYAGQRRQIVLTATEFSNVKDVQILIDGKRIDYLGEGVWIGSPVSRAML